jgi:hypothetical protein
MNGFPEELSDEFKKLSFTCADFRRDCIIYPTLTREEILRRIGLAKADVISAIIQVSSIINKNLIVESKFEFARKQKFNEDLGEIIKKMNKIDSLKNATGFNHYIVAYDCKTDLDSSFDFVIYRPITLINKENIKGIKEYIQKLFDLCSSNCSTLAHVEREESGTSKRASPSLSTSSMQLLESFPDKKEKKGKEDEDDEDEDDEEEEKKEKKGVRKRV